MKKPTLDEVKAYWAGDATSAAPSLLGDPEEFYDHFTANGWMVGRSPMKDWHAAARNWSRNEVKFGHSGQVQNRPETSDTSWMDFPPGSPERAAAMKGKP